MAVQWRVDPGKGARHSGAAIRAAALLKPGGANRPTKLVLEHGQQRGYDGPVLLQVEGPRGERVHGPRGAAGFRFPAPPPSPYNPPVSPAGEKARFLGRAALLAKIGMAVTYLWAVLVTAQRNVEGAGEAPPARREGVGGLIMPSHSSPPNFYLVRVPTQVPAHIKPFLHGSQCSTPHRHPRRQPAQTWSACDHGWQCPSRHVVPDLT